MQERLEDAAGEIIALHQSIAEKNSQCDLLQGNLSEHQSKVYALSVVENPKVRVMPGLVRENKSNAFDVIELWVFVL